MSPAVTPVTIPFEGTALNGYLYQPPRGGPQATCIMHGGFDSTAEEWHHVGALAAQQRGYTVITFDGPGHPGPHYRDGLVFRPQLGDGGEPGHRLGRGPSRGRSRAHRLVRPQHGRRAGPPGGGLRAADPGADLHRRDLRHRPGLHRPPRPGRGHRTQAHRRHRPRARRRAAAADAHQPAVPLGRPPGHVVLRRRHVRGRTWPPAWPTTSATGSPRRSPARCSSVAPSPTSSSAASRRN